MSEGFYWSFKIIVILMLGYTIVIRSIKDIYWNMYIIIVKQVSWCEDGRSFCVCYDPGAFNIIT